MKSTIKNLFYVILFYVSLIACSNSDSSDDNKICYGIIKTSECAEITPPLINWLIISEEIYLQHLAIIDIAQDECISLVDGHGEGFVYAIGTGCCNFFEDCELVPTRGPFW